MTRKSFTISMLLFLLTLAVSVSGSTANSQETRAKNKGPLPEGKTVYGKVAEIDANKIVIENPYGAKKEIKMDTNTKFRNAKNKNIKLTDITSGWMVKVTFREADLTAMVVQEDVKK